MYSFIYIYFYPKWPCFWYIEEQVIFRHFAQGFLQVAMRRHRGWNRTPFWVGSCVTLLSLHIPTTHPVWDSMSSILNLHAVHTDHSFCDRGAEVFDGRLRTAKPPPPPTPQWVWASLWKYKAPFEDTFLEKEEVVFWLKRALRQKWKVR